METTVTKTGNDHLSIVPARSPVRPAAAAPTSLPDSATAPPAPRSAELVLLCPGMAPPRAANSQGLLQERAARRYRLRHTCPRRTWPISRRT
ncbi:hypothetical protein CRV15_29490 (plasmid) [Streptomyces clavuligerus]|nr:hypothetical protein CRV15_29490 [Streptomyces clavuligerus]